MKSSLYILIVLLCLAIPPLAGQVAMNITLEGEHQTALGAVCGIVAEGDLVFLSGSQHVLMCIDVSNPSQPVLLHYASFPSEWGSYQLTPDFGKLWKSGNNLFVYLGEGCLGVFSYVEGEGFQALTSFQDPSGIYPDGYFQGSRFICRTPSWSELKIWDFSNIMSPQVLGSYLSPTYILDYAVDGNYIYFNSMTHPSPIFFRISVLDISDPTEPILISNYNELLNHIIYHNGYIYGFLNPFSLAVFDATNPLNISYLGTVNYPLYPSPGEIETLIKDGYLYIRHDDVLHDKEWVYYSKYICYDLSNPAIPVPGEPILGFFRYGGAFTVENNRLLVTDYFSNLSIHAPANSNQITGIGCFSGHAISAIQELGGYLYLSNGHIVDLDDPDRQISPFRYSPYLASDGNYHDTITLTKWDISEPELPQPIVTRQIGSAEYPNSSPLSIVQDHIYYGSGIINTAMQATTHVYSPQLAGSSRFVCSYPYAYAAHTQGVKIFEISDPSYPRLMNTLPIQGGVNDLAISGNMLYLAANTSPGLRILNLSDPINPWICGFMIALEPQTRIIHTGHSVVTIGSSGLRVIGVSDPLNPILRGHHYIPGLSYYDLTLQANQATVSHGSHLGFYDIEAALALPNPEEPTLPPARISISAHPNPFRQTSHVTLKLSAASELTLSVYNIKGQMVKELYSGFRKPGDFQLCWDGCDRKGRRQASGIYFLRLQSPQGNRCLKILRME